MAWLKHIVVKTGPPSAREIYQFIFSANTVYIHYSVQIKYTVYLVKIQCILYIQCPVFDNTVHWAESRTSVEWRRLSRWQIRIHLQNEFLQNYWLEKSKTNLDLTLTLIMLDQSATALFRQTDTQTDRQTDRQKYFAGLHRGRISLLRQPDSPLDGCTSFAVANSATAALCFDCKAIARRLCTFSKIRSQFFWSGHKIIAP